MIVKVLNKIPSQTPGSRDWLSPKGGLKKCAVAGLLEVSPGLPGGDLPVCGQGREGLRCPRPGIPSLQKDGIPLPYKYWITNPRLKGGDYKSPQASHIPMSRGEAGITNPDQQRVGEGFFYPVYPFMLKIKAYPS